MCLLTFFKPGAYPDVAALYNGSVFNDDGHGWAIVDSDRIIQGRSMDANRAIDEFCDARILHPGGPALFHSRFGTHGLTTLNNVHPFCVDGDGRTVLAHNGVLPATCQPRKGDPRSDTKILADTLASRFGSMRHRRNRLKVERWLTPANKVVILTVNRRFRDDAYILNEDAGTWTKDGVWYSNNGYKPYVTRYRHVGNQWVGADADWAGWSPQVGTSVSVSADLCNDCGQDLDGCTCAEPTWSSKLVCRMCSAPAGESDLVEGYCAMCGLCFDCDEMPPACLCYMPAAMAEKKKIG
jgi:glutamine amidotransferase